MPWPAFWCLPASRCRPPGNTGVALTQFSCRVVAAITLFTHVVTRLLASPSFLAPTAAAFVTPGAPPAAVSTVCAALVSSSLSAPAASSTAFAAASAAAFFDFVIHIICSYFRGSATTPFEAVPSFAFAAFSFAAVSSTPAAATSNIHTSCSYSGSSNRACF